ncbi:hypothetical protein AnigIFM59636_009487 [Aspergillus niger]|nr:hypothetical protein AnigIFM59636_009487 [Aspergillus niger]
MSDPKLRQTPHEDDCLNYLIAPSPRRLPGYKRPVLTDAYPSAIDATMGSIMSTSSHTSTPTNLDYQYALHKTESNSTDEKPLASGRR